MATIKVDFSKQLGKIKPLHGVGQPPFRADVYECPDYSMFSWLKEAGIPYSRLHDVGGAFGGNRFVDMPVDGAMVYDARFNVGPYAILFNPKTAQPYAALYGMKAFNELYKLGTQVALECDREKVYAVAAVNEAEGCIVIDNYTQEEISLDLQLNGEITGCYLINEDNLMIPCDLPETVQANDILCIKVKV